MKKLFIDGREGTTGLQIDQRIKDRGDLVILSIDPEKRKDINERRRLLNQADFVILCLPDAAAREAVSLIENPITRVIDASTAHRTAPGWDYGFPELSRKRRRSIADSKRVANPGCYATGFITLVYPLVTLGILPKDYPLSAHSVSGYTGAGKAVIAAYESDDRPVDYDSPRQYAMGLRHKHLPEMQLVCGLESPPIFNPIICDFPQGMVVTVPLFLDRLGGISSVDGLRRLYSDFYGGQRFIKVRDGEPDGGFLAANSLADTNDLEIFVCGNAGQAIAAARFDNLGKGASGAAVQNLNIMLGAYEDYGFSQFFNSKD